MAYQLKSFCPPEKIEAAAQCKLQGLKKSTATFLLKQLLPGKRLHNQTPKYADPRLDPSIVMKEMDAKTTLKFISEYPPVTRRDFLANLNEPYLSISEAKRAREIITLNALIEKKPSNPAKVAAKTMTTGIFGPIPYLGLGYVITSFTLYALKPNTYTHLNDAFIETGTSLLNGLQKYTEISLAAASGYALSILAMSIWAYRQSTQANAQRLIKISPDPPPLHVEQKKTTCLS